MNDQQYYQLLQDLLNEVQTMMWVAGHTPHLAQYLPSLAEMHTELTNGHLTEKIIEQHKQLLGIIDSAYQETIAVRIMPEEPAEMWDDSGMPLVQDVKTDADQPQRENDEILNQPENQPTLNQMNYMPEEETCSPNPSFSPNASSSPKFNVSSSPDASLTPRENSSENDSWSTIDSLSQNESSSAKNSPEKENFSPAKEKSPEKETCLPQENFLPKDPRLQKEVAALKNYAEYLQWRISQLKEEDSADVRLHLKNLYDIVTGQTRIPLAELIKKAKLIMNYDLERQRKIDIDTFKITFRNLIQERLQDEWKSWNQHHPPGFSAKLSVHPDGSENIGVWNCNIPGVIGTPWEGGLYPVILTFTDYFPTLAPTFYFHALLTHPNIDPYTGEMFLEDDHYKWQPSRSVTDMLLQLQHKLHKPILSSSETAENPDAAALYARHDELYEAYVRDLAARYQDHSQSKREAYD